MPRRKPEPAPSSKRPRKKAAPKAKPNRGGGSKPGRPPSATAGLLPGGHNEHVPTAATRQLVKNAAGIGLQRPLIGQLIGISEPTLVKHYGPELDLGKASATFKVASALYTQATEKPNLAAMIFWLKAQGGWREKHVLDDPAGQNAVAGLAALVLASGLDDSKANGLPPGGGA